MVAEQWAELQRELEGFGLRFAQIVELDVDHRSDLESLTWNEPGEAASWMLGAHAIGEWTLSEEELLRLWLIGRTAGYTREQLLADSILAKALPDRAQRPPDPPGDFVQTPVLGGGGHGARRGLGGKREFPIAWTDHDSIRHTMDVARHPSGAVELPSGDFRAYGERDGVLMSVLVSPQGAVLTSYPVEGAGVVDNPLDAERTPHVERLQQLLDALVPPSTDEARVSLDELMAVGEWPHVIASLRMLDIDAEQRTELDGLARLAGLAT